MTQSEYQQLMLETLHEVKEKVESLDNKIDASNEKHAELDTRLTVQETKFVPIQKIVYSCVSVVLLGFVSGLVYLVGWKK